MKKLIIYWLSVLLAACNSQGGDAVEGVYSNIAVSEYSKAYDTLIVDKPDERTRSCVVHRRTGYIRIVAGKQLPRQFKSDTMITAWHPATKQLSDLKTGRRILFRKRALLFGTALYQKQ